MGDLEDRVILDTMDDLGGPQGSYPEGFVSLSLFLADIYKFVVLVKKHDRHTYMIHDTLQKFNIDDYEGRFVNAKNSNLLNICILALFR